MKKWLLLAAVAAAAVLVAKRLSPAQTDSDVVSDVIHDDAPETPVQTAPKKPDAVPSAEVTEEKETSSEVKNS